MVAKLPRLLIAGLSGDSGKTIVSLSLLTALSQKGVDISVFKKGPDYIDSAWLSIISKTQCRNLDTYLVEPDDVYNIFTGNAGKDISIIEGNRGIFDGKDVSGTHSTAGLAKLLRAPIILVVDATKSTRTIAALVKGCIDFDPDIVIAGIVLNRIAGERHKKIITQSIEKYCGLPVLGSIPKLDKNSTIIPGRHLGLVTPQECENNLKLNSILLEIAEKYLNIGKLIEIANNAEILDAAAAPASRQVESKTNNNEKIVKIGYFKDSVFTFYYPENLEALEASGAELTAISSLNDKSLPDIDALYIGGGFPETQAQLLAGNKSMMESVRKAAVSGMPIYAECGGLIYLSRSLKYDGKLFLMAGVFPIDLKINPKPVGHGYTSIKIDYDNPYFETGSTIKGHEFHYSGLAANQLDNPIDSIVSCMDVLTGYGIGKQRDGLVYNNTLACYTHIHAAGNEKWAENLIENALQYKEKRSNRSNSWNSNYSKGNNCSNNLNSACAVQNISYCG
ncbi:MAG: cobyrinate a,c-diamide synthase [candidate division Zixibacteria bacterium]|nr:cobyrinate a,c-diamide synthase [candidate division Zixibacteria bacterium]